MRQVRLALPGDAEAIASVHVHSWREAYAGLLSAGFLEGLDVGRRAGFWRDVLQAGTAEVVVAQEPEGVVGFAAVLPDAGPRDLKLAGIYLRARWHGSGLGQRLLDEVLGGRPAYLWVAEENPRAIAFYCRNGFRLDGERRTEARSEDLAVVRMVR